MAGNIKMKPVTNPMLVGAMELLRAEDTPEHRRLVMEEIAHAKFLSPVTIDPKPIPDENGMTKITAEHKIQLPMLTAGDKHFFMAFTDMGELKQWKDPNPTIFGFTIKDYINMIQGAGDTCDGVAINPFGNNMVLSKELIENVFANKM